MILQLWGSWFLLFGVTELIAMGLLTGSVLLLAAIPGRRDRRMMRLLAHNGRGVILIWLSVMVLALGAVYGIAGWWFSLIAFEPHGVAVFGSVGIAAVTWLANLILKRRQWLESLHRSQSGDE
ncbi:hypothetical protein [Lacticaseibacillus suihuaensis]